MKITISAKQLRSVIEPMLPLTGDDYMLPVLNALHIRSEGGDLITTATDRFVVGVKRTPGAFGEFEILLPVASARSILRAFKPMRSADPELTLEVVDFRLYISTAGAFVDFDEARIGYALCDGQFPKVKSVIQDALAAEPDHAESNVAAFSPVFLGRFAAFGPTLAIKVQRRGPTVVTNGVDFVGAIMPRRTIADGELDVTAVSFAEMVAPVASLVTPVIESKPAAKRARKAVSA